MPIIIFNLSCFLLEELQPISRTSSTSKSRVGVRCEMGDRGEKATITTHPPHQYGPPVSLSVTLFECDWQYSLEIAGPSPTRARGANPFGRGCTCYSFIAGTLSELHHRHTRPDLKLNNIAVSQNVWLSINHQQHGQDTLSAAA